MKRGIGALVAVALLGVMGRSVVARADTMAGTFSTTGFTQQYHIAVWVEDQAGNFVKTVALWARTSSSYLDQLVAWNDASGGNTTDAVTSATLSGNKTGLAFAWDGTNLSGTAVANGTYTLQIESVERNDKLSQSTTSIVLNGTTKTVAGTATAKLTSISIAITGGSTPTNRPPVFTSATTVSAPTGSTTTYTPVATDADGNAVTYTFSNYLTGALPSWVVANGAATSLAITPTSPTPARDTVRIFANDGNGGRDTLNLIITVQNTTVNRAPVFAPNRDTVRITTGSSVKWVAKATDADGNALTYTYATLPTNPAWITRSAAPARDTLTIAPVTGSTSLSLAVVATDGNGGLDTLALRVIVQPPVSAIDRSSFMGASSLTLGGVSIALPRTGERSLTVRLFTLSGARVAEWKIGARDRAIPIMGLRAGLYMVKVKTESSVTAQRVMLGRN